MDKQEPFKNFFEKFVPGTLIKMFSGDVQNVYLFTGMKGGWYVLKHTESKNEYTVTSADVLKYYNNSGLYTFYFP